MIHAKKGRILHQDTQAVAGLRAHDEKKIFKYKIQHKCPTATTQISARQAATTRLQSHEKKNYYHNENVAQDQNSRRLLAASTSSSI
jgi:hypothetical protein